VSWLRHAFAVDPEGAAEPNDAQRRVIDRICAEVVRRRMTTPALLALEMGRPLNYVSAQLLHFFQPFLAIVADTAAYDQFASFLEQRGSAEYIAARLGALESSDGDSARA
jgi:hypothetical protein